MAYRLTVLGCALSWFLVGLHVPALHGMSHHGGGAPWPFLSVFAVLALLGVAGLWALLRVLPGGGRRPARA